MFTVATFLLNSADEIGTQNCLKAILQIFDAVSEDIEVQNPDSFKLKFFLPGWRFLRFYTS